MRFGILSLGRPAVFALVATTCIAAAFGCSAETAAEPAGAQDDVTAATPAVTPPPPAPTSPLPPELQLDGGAPPPPSAPAKDPTLRSMWAVDATGRLVSFTNKDTKPSAPKAVTGLAANERILGIDVRPSDGQLYALGSSSRLYVIDKTTAVAKAVGAKAFTPGLAGTTFGFDVNPVPDKIRVHSDTDQNLRLDPTTGAATVDGTLAFAAGDPNQGQSPNLVATAYTNSVKPAPTTTTLYALDSTRNLLVKLASPNDGKVTTVGALGVDATDVGGFDIWGKDGALEAYATLTVTKTVAGKSVDETSLYAIDLAKGAATPIAKIDHPVALSGLAVEP